MGSLQTKQSERNNFWPLELATQNCPLPAGSLRPPHLAGKPLQNTWPTQDHRTSRVGREPPHTQVGTFDTSIGPGMATALGWVGWQVPCTTDALQLTRDFKPVKHHIRQQLRSQNITHLIATRPRQFAGMHYHTNGGWFVPASPLCSQNRNARCCAHYGLGVSRQRSTHTSRA